MSILFSGCIIASVGNASAAYAVNGRALAKTYCSRCHSVGRVGVSPVSQAPAFRDLHYRYDVEDLPEILADGVRTGHPAMPEWLLDPDDGADLAAYVVSIQSR
jgi:mono/diheme cytochrome c family protein